MSGSNTGISKHDGGMGTLLAVLKDLTDDALNLVSKSNHNLLLKASKVEVDMRSKAGKEQV